MKRTELFELGRRAGFDDEEIEMADEELMLFAELAQSRIISQMLSAPEGYVIYTPYRLH